MARKVDVKEVGEYRFRAKQWKARKANRVLERLIDILGEGLGKIADNLGEEDRAKAIAGDLSREGVGEAIAALTKKLNGEQINWLIDESLSDLEVHTTEMAPDQFVPIGPDMWDDVFAGRIFEQFKVLAWVLELNYSSFFDGLGGLRGAVQRLVTPATKST